MPSHRLTKSSVSINWNITESLKHTIIRLNQPIRWENVGLKWREKAFGLIKERMLRKKPRHIFIHLCGRREEMKLLFLYKERLEGGLQEKEQTSWRKKKRRRKRNNLERKRNIEEMKNKNTKGKSIEELILEPRMILIYYMMSSSYGEQAKFKR